MSPVSLDRAVWPVVDPAPPRTLVEVLDATVRGHPDAPALEAGGVVLSYRALRSAAESFAGTLRAHGVGPGDRVGVRVPSGTTDLYVAILGVLVAGAAYVPVDVDDPDERAGLIWQDAGVCVVVGEGLGLVAGPGRAGSRTGPPDLGDDAWIIFTSGTTGRPKGVAVTHRSAAAFVDAEARLFVRSAPLGPGDRVLAGLSVAFDASCEEMWLAWRHGACLVPAPRSLVKAGTDLGPWLVERGITVVSTVPTLVALWPAEALARVRLLIVGGESCPPELVERLAVPGREFWNTYGPTEATVVACVSLMRSGEPVRIGIPLDGWELAVVDAAGKPVPWGTTGELLIGGVGTARYLDPDKDTEKFAAHPALRSPRVYRTGDLVRAEREGLIFVGRADEQVKIGGRRIELGEVDAALQALPGVRAAAAAVKDSPAGGQVLVGYLVLAVNTGHEASQLTNIPHQRSAGDPANLDINDGLGFASDPSQSTDFSDRPGFGSDPGLSSGSGDRPGFGSDPSLSAEFSDRLGFGTDSGRSSGSSDRPGFASDPGRSSDSSAASFSGPRSGATSGSGGGSTSGPGLSAGFGPGSDPAPSISFDRDAARALLLQRLPPALVPVLAVVDNLPTRTSGKVDRKALPWPLPGHASASSDAGAELGGTAGWVAEQWRRLLGVPVEPDSDFFALGGSSLTAARLVAEMRERFPAFTVKDLYQHPRLVDLAAFLGEDDDPAAGRKPRVRHRRVHLTPSTAGLYQGVVLVLLFLITAIPWVLGVAALDNVLGPVPWAPHTSWWLIVGGWLALSSAPARVVFSGLGARLFTLNLQPGSYPRGGWTHLRLWTAERLVGAFSLGAVVGTPLAGRYARLLGCRVGRDVELHTLPPVTGMAAFGDGAVLEPEVDAAGWWIEGDLLHVGGVRVGPGASVGTRSMLMPGADLEAGALVAAGSCVTSRVPAGERWHGTPARRDDVPPTFRWPPPEYGRSARIALLHTLSLPALQLLPLVAALPALALLTAWKGPHPTPGSLAGLLLATSVPLTLLTVFCYALLVALTVRIASRTIRPGVYPAHGGVGFRVWLVHRLMATARGTLFPLYASMLTPVWLRLLGARIGRRVEASTALALPSLLTVDDHAFLADDTLVAPYEIRGGWLRLGPSRIGKRSFVGNSGIVGPFRTVPDESLIGVLSDAPPDAGPGGSWLGRPSFPVQRQAEGGESTDRTYDPPARLLAARAAVELCRWLPVLATVLLGDLAVIAVQAAYDRFGLYPAFPIAMLALLGCGITACLLTTAAKWLLIGRFTVSQKPLWSSFVWRNELFDTFVEELAMPWLGTSLIGTPFLSLWMRSLGARIGRGVWCESHWLPETDLVRLGDGATVNRGVVLQTHLFQDRLMRMDTVTLGRGATLGPHAIALPGSRLDDAAVAGPSSLVMRGDRLRAGTRWHGNPVAHWDPVETPKAEGPRTVVRDPVSAS
ncbi:Pls/PosA family non-ribosomal peptide synthetase [Catenulispora yoronensis]